MKLLILGGSGMAGHMLVRYFRRCSEHAVFYTRRDTQDEFALELDGRNTEQLRRIIQVIRPQIIMNAMGVLNDSAAHDPVAAYQVNSLLPHQLKLFADQIGAKLIHISTDCVFEGDKGGYTESDLPDGQSMYAVTKALGEVKDHPVHLTIRTSIIGPEIRANGIGLFDWFMKQKGNVSGYEKVLWNGVTTLELAKAIHYYMERDVAGLIHLTAPEGVSKSSLLQLLKKEYKRNDLIVVPQEYPVLDRTLRSTRADADFIVSDYESMVRALSEWMRRV